MKQKKKADQNWERSLRIQADTENILRRAERDVAQAYKFALEPVVSDLLPVIDNLERALMVNPQANPEEMGAVIEGVRLTVKMFHAVLEKHGVQQVNPELQPFNPEYHQAVSTQADNKVKPGTVITVLQKGYLLNNRLVRPALVVVAKTD